MSTHNLLNYVPRVGQQVRAYWMSDKLTVLQLLQDVLSEISRSRLLISLRKTKPTSNSFSRLHVHLNLPINLTLIRTRKIRLLFKWLECWSSWMSQEAKLLVLEMYLNQVKKVRDRKACFKIWWQIKKTSRVAVLWEFPSQVHFHS